MWTEDTSPISHPSRPHQKLLQMSYCRQRSWMHNVLRGECHTLLLVRSSQWYDGHIALSDHMYLIVGRVQMWSVCFTHMYLPSWLELLCSWSLVVIWVSLHCVFCDAQSNYLSILARKKGSGGWLRPSCCTL